MKCLTQINYCVRKALVHYCSALLPHCITRVHTLTRGLSSSRTICSVRPSHSVRPRMHASLQQEGNTSYRVHRLEHQCLFTAHTVFPVHGRTSRHVHERNDSPRSRDTRHSTFTRRTVLTVHERNTSYRVHGLEPLGQFLGPVAERREATCCRRLVQGARAGLSRAGRAVGQPNTMAWSLRL